MRLRELEAENGELEKLLAESLLSTEALQDSCARSLLNRTGLTRRRRCSLASSDVIGRAPTLFSANASVDSRNKHKHDIGQRLRAVLWRSLLPYFRRMTTFENPSEDGCFYEQDVLNRFKTGTRLSCVQRLRATVPSMQAHLSEHNPSISALLWGLNRVVFFEANPSTYSILQRSRKIDQARCQPNLARARVPSPDAEDCSLVFASNLSVSYCWPVGIPLPSLQRKSLRRAVGTCPELDFE